MSSISIISDEISFDIHTAAEISAELGVNKLAIRNVGMGRVPQIETDWANAITNVLSKNAVSISSVMPGLFLGHSGAARSRIQSSQGIAEVLEMATLWKPSHITVFAFERKDERGKERAVSVLRNLAEKLAEQNIRLAIQTAKNTHANSIEKIENLLSQLPETVDISYDPARLEKDASTNIEKIANRIAYVHIKDISDTGEMVMLGDGIVGFQELIKKLNNSSFSGEYLIDSHLSPRVASVRTCVERLNAWCKL